MTPRQRVLDTLNFKPTDRVPRDLGAMRSSGISAFAYPRLVQALGLPPRRPRVHDTHQMLALPDLDVLDALGCDVVTIDGGVTNAFEEPEKWGDYEFNGRLAARVCEPASFSSEPDGTIWQRKWNIWMPPESFVFNSDHSGQPMLEPDKPLPLLDLKQYRADLEKWALTDEQIRTARDLCRRVRESTDRAVFYADHFNARIAITAHGGLAVFPVVCMLEPEYVNELHQITVDHVKGEIRKLLPEIRNYIDVALTGGDDWGTQNSLIASPAVFRDLFLPYYKQVNAEFHRHAPNAKAFLHSCGAIYPLLDMIIESGFDVINPVQWPAGGRGYAAWKDKARGKASFWGGGVDSQHTLPNGSLEDVRTSVAAIVDCFAEGGGYVFNSIHNLLAEVPAEKIIEMYRVAGQRKPQ
jgi:uroporphyrinogen decarboxylase